MRNAAESKKIDFTALVLCGQYVSETLVFICHSDFGTRSSNLEETNLLSFQPNPFPT